MKLGHFDKHFVKNLRKKRPAGENFGVFSPRYPQIYILNSKFKLRIIESGPFFFPKSVHFF